MGDNQGDATAAFVSRPVGIDPTLSSISLGHSLLICSGFPDVLLHSLWTIDATVGYYGHSSPVNAMPDSYSPKPSGVTGIAILMNDD